MPKNTQDFERELESLRKVLAEQGRIVPRKAMGSTGEGGIQGDFDLPYSSFPPHLGDKWIKTTIVP